MTLSIKALLADEPTEANEEAEEKKSYKGKKRMSKKDDGAEEELREWKDDANSGVSIADLINLDK